MMLRILQKIYVLMEDMLLLRVPEMRILQKIIQVLMEHL